MESLAIGVIVGIMTTEAEEPPLSKLTTLCIVVELTEMELESTLKVMDGATVDVDVAGVVLGSLAMGVIVGIMITEAEEPPWLKLTTLCVDVEPTAMELGRTLKVRDPGEKVDADDAVVTLVRMMIMEKPELRLVVGDMMTAEVNVELSPPKLLPMFATVEPNDWLEVWRILALRDPATLNADSEASIQTMSWQPYERVDVGFEVVGSADVIPGLLVTGLLMVEEAAVGLEPL